MKKRGLFSKWFILPGVVAAMLASLVLGFTRASFNDIETSSASTAAAWASTLWTQTSQADFEAGVLTSVNATLSAGDVILSAGGSAGGANMTLFWDGGAAPSGWTIVSNVGGPFYQALPRGAATYGGTGGTATHSHTVSLVSDAGPSATTAVRGGGNNRSSATHTHALASSSTDAVSNLPSYRNLQVIKYNSGVPAMIPAGAIAIFDAAAPTGWTQYSAQNGFYVRGEATAGATGGANTETHSVNISLSASAGYQGVATQPQGAVVANTDHTHSGNGTTVSTDKQPPYITVILAKANSDTAIPGGMIAMFDASPTGNWNVISGVGGAFDSRFIVGSSSYGTTGGSDNHTPANLLITTGGPTTTAGTRITSANAYAASNTHTHGITVSFGSSSDIPPYIDVIFAKALYYSSGTIASQVLDTAVTSSRWDGLVWDRTLPTSTNVTFEVRASDTSFLKTDATPSWTSVGDASPVISGLPSGRYKQWRATLSTANVTQTPVLNEVRVYYYGG